MPASEAIGPDTTADFHFGGLAFREGRYASDFKMPSHLHEEARLVFMLEGTVQHVCRKQPYLLTPSSLIYIPAGEPHIDHFHGGVKAFLIELKPDWLDRYMPVAPFLDTPSRHQHGIPIWLATRLHREFQQRDSLMPLMLEGLILELVTEMGRSAPYGEEITPPHWLRHAHDFLHAHFTEPLSVETIATAVGVHPSHLMRTFRKHYHLSIGDFVRKLRIEYACHLLSTSSLFLAQVAHEVGFAHQSHFCRTFKSLTDMTPAEYRKMSGHIMQR
ncbi:MAG: transcriptional regulator, AraC family [Chthonomonadales bacterium]|nr:transcriptional regulator, AraC family [Chthonomonadales bacterium]